MTKKKNRGWIRIYRQIEDSEIWDNEEPFDVRSAWIDLILMANHEDRTILINGHPQLIDVGQKWTSVRTLAARWHWSKDRVMRYTKMLEKLGMITMNKTPTGTLLTIVNYGLFQGMRDTNKDTNKDTGKDTGKDADKDETRTIKNYKNEEERALPRRTNLLDGKRQ
jgi:DNA replication protein DnaD